MMKISKRKMIDAIIAILTFLPLFVRAFSGTVYGSTDVMAATLFFAIGLSVLMVVHDKRSFKLIDFFFLVMLLFYMFWRNNIKYGFQSYLLITIAFFVVSFYLRERMKAIQFVILMVLTFSILSSLATWLQLLTPNVYFSSVANLFNEGTRQTVISEYTTQGRLSGLAYHFSPNAFYVMNGALVLLSDLLVNRNKELRKLKYTILFFLIITMFAIGKRGHILFFALTILFVSLLLTPNFAKKVTKSLKYIVVAVIFTIISYYVFPDARRIFKRVFQYLGSNDLNYISSGRIFLYRTAFQLFRSNMFLGAKIGSFAVSTLLKYNGVHNDYLQFLCETGIIGFFVFTIGNAFMFKRAVKMLKALNNCDASLIWLKKIIMYCVMIQCFVFAYSFTGLPHFDYEINGIYILTCMVPYGVQKYINIGVDKQ